MLTMTLGDLIGVQSLMSGFGMVSLCVIVPTLLLPASAGLWCCNVTFLHSRSDKILLFSTNWQSNRYCCLYNGLAGPPIQRIAPLILNLFAIVCLEPNSDMLCFYLLQASYLMPVEDTSTYMPSVDPC